MAEKIIDVISLLNVPRTTFKHAEKAGSKKLDLYQAIMDMPRIFFPDEYMKPIPSISISKEGFLKLKYPAQLALKKFFLHEVVVFHSGDGQTTSFTIPYFHDPTKS